MEEKALSDERGGVTINRVGLSIDYDFFQDSKKIEEEFWGQLERRHLKPFKIVYDDDHKNAYYFFEPIRFDVLIHFDHHSDCYDKNLSAITTENWVLKLMKIKPKLKVIWIQNKIKIVAEGSEQRSVIKSENFIEPPFCFKELNWEYDPETKEHFLEKDSPPMRELLEVWTQLDKTIDIAEIKKPNVIGCYVSRSPPWTKDRTTQDFESFLKHSHVGAVKWKP